MFDDIMHTTEDGTVEFGMQESLWDVWGIQHGEDLKMR